MPAPTPPNGSPDDGEDREPIIPLTTSIPATGLDAAGVRAKRGAKKEKLPRTLLPLFVVTPFLAVVPQFGNNLSTYFAAIQVQLIDPEGKVAALAVVSAVAATAGMIAAPFFGVLSDRTRSRFGRRRPWIFVTALVGALGLIAAGFSTTIPLLVVTIAITQLGFGSMNAPWNAILPDQVATRFRGRYSTLAGLGGLVAAVAAGIYGRFFLDSIPTGYIAAAIVALLITTLYVFVIKDKDTRDLEREPFSLLTFLRAYWVNPIKHPDFAFGFAGRFLLFGSYGLINTYLLYIAQDYVGLPLDEAATVTALLGLVALPSILISVSISGPISDRIGRRKPLVLIAGLLIVLGCIVPIISATVGGLVISNIIIGFGFGMFISVDQALMSSVLPDPERYGTDLGVLTIATGLPYAIGPLVAGIILGIFGSYLALYIFVAVVALVGALAVLGIKSVR